MIPRNPPTPTQQSLFLTLALRLTGIGGKAVAAALILSEMNT
jgi:hypothetical protein